MIYFDETEIIMALLCLIQVSVCVIAIHCLTTKVGFILGGTSLSNQELLDGLEEGVIFVRADCQDALYSNESAKEFLE